ncbi:MAG TPA: glutathione peroxidase [Polyangiales bacterium]
MANLHDFTVSDIHGKPVALRDYQGKVLLVVNTASQCGFTPQYEGLQALHAAYHDRGLAVLGFPCNQFGHQEPGSNDQIQSFCETKFAVSFPLFDKIDVNGPAAAPLFTHLKAAAPGLLGSQKIKWNFTKFLVSKDGQSVTRFAPSTKPKALTGAITRLLG